MRILSEAEQRGIVKVIVHEFSNGTFKEGKYLFDQIKGVLGSQVKLNQALTKVNDKEVILLFDRHPNNEKCAHEVTSHLGVLDAWGVTLLASDLPETLRYIDCDMYVTTLVGKLLIVACHEHDWTDQDRTDRTVWLAKGD